MATTIQHYQDLGDFDYGTCDQVTPLVRRVICKNPTPFTYKGTGTYLIGQGEVAVVDPGPPLLSHLDDILDALDPGEVITHAFITHTHSDHSPLTKQLKERTGAISYGYGPHGAVREDDPNDRILVGVERIPFVESNELAVLAPTVLFGESSALSWRRFQLHISIGQAF